ncbi:IS3 family transposase [Aeromonas media]|uniref:IS3 family transposase n=1 Tax=Aeromonas media TaxID=651 RepID=UPI00399059E5
MMNVHPSGYYAWQHQPLSARALEDQLLLGQIKQCWLESGGIYGYRKIRDDLREMGEICGKHRVARLMRHEGLRSQTVSSPSRSLWWPANSGCTESS